MKVRILRSGVNDLIEGRQFYDLQGEGLGDYFFNTLFSEIDSLTLYAGIHSKFHGFYKRLSDTFPYAIYYRMAEGEVLIFRVLDCRQNPRKIRKKLKEG